MSTKTELSSACQIAAVARYKTMSQYSVSMGRGNGCFGDVQHDELRVDAKQWERLPQRAKTFGARWEQGRGWDGSVDGKAFGWVVAEDGSRCKVVLV